MKYKTWANYHPEVAKNAGKPFIPWPCEKYTTEFPGVHQCSVSMGPQGELIVAGSHAGQGALFHSLDQGRTWKLLCSIPDLSSAVPTNFKLWSHCFTGSGYAGDGSLLAIECWGYNDGRPYEGHQDETFHRMVQILRSSDHGKTWVIAQELDPAPYDVIGGNEVSIRRLPDNRLFLPQNVCRVSRPGKPLPLDEYTERAFLYCSEDHGQSWYKLASLGEHTDESWIAEHSSGRLVAVTRYQRKKLPHDPPEMATPYYFEKGHPRENCPGCKNGPAAVGGHSIYKQSAVLSSADGGKSWSKPCIVTGWIQQTGCIVALADGTIVLPFSHKDGTHGQRFIISYDAGETWSNAIWELNDSGLYASSVIMPDDTIVTVHDGYKGKGTVRRLSALRWKVPLKNEVEKHGFFRPRPADV